MHNHHQAEKILADAFLHYPLMQYAFEGRSEEDRGKSLQHLFKHCTSAAAIYGGVIITPDEQGALIWLPGKNFPLDLVREIKSGMWIIPFALGIKPTLRLINHDAEPEGWIKKNAEKNFGYIWNIGVTENARGKGYSRKLIDKAIEQMRAQGMNEFWLKTEDPKNVMIYQKLGLVLVYETVVKSSGVRSWVMRRK